MHDAGSVAVGGTLAQLGRMGLRGLFWLLLGVLLVAALGCQREPVALVDVLGVTPKIVGPQDRLEILGRSLPSGKRGTLELEGWAYQPGSSPRRVRVEQAVTTRPEAAVTFVAGELQAALVGKTQANHTTFRGSLKLSFPPADAGAPPVTGRVQGVVFDVLGTEEPETKRNERRQTAERWLGYLGITLATQSSPLLVAEVHPGGLAARLGVREKDVLVELDSVNLLDSSDLVPQDDRNVSELVLRRATAAEAIVLEVPTGAFHQRPPPSVAVSLVVIGALAMALSLWHLSPLGRALGWLSAQLAFRLVELRRGAPSGVSKHKPGSSSKALWFGLVASVLAGLVLGALAWVGSRSSGTERLTMMFGVAVLLLGTTVALVGGGKRAHGRWSLWAALGAAFTALAHHALLLLCVAVTALLTGTFDVSRMAGAQGPWPWQWHAFKDPLGLLAFVVFVACLAPAYFPPKARLAHAALRTDSALPSLSDWVLLATHAALGSTFFLGAWQPATLGAASWPMAALGLFLYATKSLALMLTALTLRWLLRGASLGQMRAWFWRWGPLAGLLLLAVSYGQSLVQLPEVARELLPLGLCLSLTLALAGFWLCTLEALKAGKEPGINPWV